MVKREGEEEEIYLYSPTDLTHPKAGPIEKIVGDTEMYCACVLPGDPEAHIYGPRVDDTFHGRSIFGDQFTISKPVTKTIDGQIKRDGTLVDSIPYYCDALYAGTLLYDDAKVIIRETDPNHVLDLQHKQGCLQEYDEALSMYKITEAQIHSYLDAKEHTSSEPLSPLSKKVVHAGRERYETPCNEDSKPIVFYQERTAVKKGERWGILDEFGQVVVPFKYETINPFDRDTGLASAKLPNSNSVVFIDETGFEYRTADELQIYTYYHGLAQYAKADYDEKISNGEKRTTLKAGNSDEHRFQGSRLYVNFSESGVRNETESLERERDFVVAGMYETAHQKVEALRAGTKEI